MVAVSVLVVGAAVLLILRLVDVADNIRDENEWALVIDIFMLMLTFCGLVFAGTQLLSNKNLNESQFLMQLNSGFIENKDLVEVERRLERFYIGEISEIEMLKDWGMNSPMRQNMIDYLVFFEGLSVSIQKHIIKIDSMDDLFAYRFFLAMHNPAIQIIELKEYPHYYRGCFVLYILLSELWLKRWIKWKRTHKDGTGYKSEPRIPLAEKALYKDEKWCEFICWNRPLLRTKVKRICRMDNKIKEKAS